MLCILFGVLLIARVLLDLIFPFSILANISNGLLLNAIFISIFISVAIMSAIGEFTFRVYTRVEADPIYVIRRQLSRRSDPQSASPAECRPEPGG
jgi:hypothetical protein